jgi:hypothetical protein
MQFFASHGAERARGASSSNGNGRFAEAGDRQPVVGSA